MSCYFWTSQRSGLWVKLYKPAEWFVGCYFVPRWFVASDKLVTKLSVASIKSSSLVAFIAVVEQKPQLDE